MSEPKPLNPTEQDALVKQIGLSLMRAAPEDWRHVTAEYRATGRYAELVAEVRSADGTMRVWSPPQDVAALFARLRGGMYREGRGSWSNARYQLDHPSSYNLDFDRAEPTWQTPPPPQAYVDEMRFFPRTDENVPDWLRRRVAQVVAPPAPPQQQPRGFRTARVFDGAGPGGRPSVNRPPVPEADRDLLLDYLDGAPVAVVGRGFDADVLNPDAPAVVPVAFQTDGHWIWPAAVGYYLREYGVPPEAELVERARANDYELPEVSEDARVAAAANLGAPAAPEDTAVPVAELPEPEPEAFDAPAYAGAEFGARAFDGADRDFEDREYDGQRYDEPAFAEQEKPVEVGATVAAPLPELLADDRDQADAPTAVEETANLAGLKPDVVEYAQEGPPYRVRFEEDGPVIDDRYRRADYVDGMDLFAPVTTYDRESGEARQGDTQTWSPFADEEPEREAAPAAGGPVVEEPSEDDPDLADVPVAEPGTAAVDERTAGFEGGHEELFPEQPEFDRSTQFADQPRFEDRTQFEERAQFDEQPRFEDRSQFDDRPRFEDQPQERSQFADDHYDEDDHTDHEHAHAEHARVEDVHAEDDHAEHSHPEHAHPEHSHAGHAQAEHAHVEHAHADHDHDHEPEPEPEPVEPRQVTEDEERELTGVRRALDELDVPPAAYRFGDPADRTWVLRTEGQDWEVAWFDHGPTNPVRFERVDDAAAYLIGKLVLTGRRTPRRLPPRTPQPPRPPAEGFRDDQHRPPVEGFREEPPHPPVNNGFREDQQARPAAEGFREDQRPPAVNGFRDDRRSAPPDRPEPPKTRSWPITPMNGEPPLTLFRHKKVVELPVGLEVDRFGDGSGNLVYAAGTPFAERSLVPSWINRPYRVYRLRRPVEALTGVAVPWFEQPGGGTAYLMPKSVEDMLADGVLVEVANQEAPTP
ncbi:TNT domain-containing protein [Actinosynnema sp. NPDC023587]|uniref:TNT domain-containing protein n=1 Tax=Actinosynnema sp. NPDC023587 TaxID=3154695 RepID=UPI0033F6DF9B